MYALRSPNTQKPAPTRRQKMRELAEENARLRSRLAKAVQESRSDALTGLSNRRQFDLAITRQIRGRSKDRSPIGLLFIDADHFKRINDTYGHAVGDLALQHLAQVLKTTAGEGHLVCRFGGEEFAILTSCTDSESLEKLGERIRKAVENSPIESPAGSLKITVSIGGALIEAAPEAFLAARLLFLADQAVYAAKTSGRNCVRVHNDVEEVPAR